MDKTDKLYDIAAEIESCIDYETGEVDSERLERAVAAEESKLEGVGKSMKNDKAYIDAVDAEIKNLQACKRTRERILEGKGRFVGQYLQGQKRTVGSVKFMFLGKQEGAVNLLVKPAELPEQYRRERISYDADKAAIKAAIEAGEDVSQYAVWDKRPKASVR